MSELMVPLSIAGTFLAVGLGVYAVAASGMERRRTVRLLGAHAGGGSASVREDDLARPFRERVGFPLVARLGRLARRMSPFDLRPRLARKLTLAGNPKGLDAERMAAFKMLAGGGFAALAFALGTTVGLDRLWTYSGTALFGTIGFVLPSAVLGQKGMARQQQILKALPDTIDLLTISVEAGLGFDAALDQVSQQVSGPMSDEIRRMLQEINLGVARVEALRTLAARTDVPELGAFVLSMVQAELFGVSVAKVLRAQAKELRVKRRQRAETLAQKTPVKLLFPLIFCVLPALFVVILGPGAIRLLSNFFGISP